MQDPIDFVVTWVDGADPAWLEEKQHWVKETRTKTAYDLRYRDWGFFNFWFRAVETYAPWVNKVYLITNGQVPEWLNLESEKLVHVRHDQYIPSEYLPTFNSNVIELAISNIEGLSEHFVLFNDDMFLTQPITPEYFFQDGQPVDMRRDIQISPRDGRFGANLFMNMSEINRYFSKDPETNAIVPRSELPNGDVIWGFYNHHGAIAYKKSVYDLVTQDKCKFEVEETMKYKFREASNVTNWLVRYWQICSGDVSLTRGYSSKLVNIESKMDLALEYLHDPGVKLLIINDEGVVKDPDGVRERYRAAFAEKLPHKSSFEL